MSLDRTTGWLGIERATTEPWKLPAIFVDYIALNNTELK